MPVSGKSKRMWGKWMESEQAGTCAKCGKEIAKEQRVFYLFASKEILCVACGTLGAKG